MKLAQHSRLISSTMALATVNSSLSYLASLSSCAYLSYRMTFELTTTVATRPLGSYEKNEARLLYLYLFSSLLWLCKLTTPADHSCSFDTIMIPTPRTRPFYLIRHPSPIPSQLGMNTSLAHPTSVYYSRKRSSPNHQNTVNSPF